MQWMSGHPGLRHEFCSAGFQSKRISGLTRITEKREVIAEIQKTV